MNVTRIRLVGLFVVDLPIILARPSDEFLLKSADGLGPTGVDVFISGKVYQGRRPQTREMVFRIGLQPNYKVNQTTASLREKLYGLLVPASDDGSITVQLMDGDTVIASTPAWVRLIEPVLFAKDPEVQITMPSTEAYFEAPEDMTFTPANKKNFIIPNVGTAPSGIEMEIVFTGARSSWSLYFGNQKMTFSGSFAIGDILYFNTQTGQKTIRRIRGTTNLEIVQFLTTDSTWFEMHGGDNTFTATDSGYNWGYVRYRPKFLGV